MLVVQLKQDMLAQEDQLQVQILVYSVLVVPPLILLQEVVLSHEEMVLSMQLKSVMTQTQ